MDKQEVGVRDFYCESQRLALEELVSGGREAYTAFLDREKMPGFLSGEEIAEISRSTVRASEPIGETLEQSFTGSQGQSTGTYFPDVSDTEVPNLELGWPTFPGNGYRGAPEVEVHFQPSYGDLIYSCKEAIRNLIRKAKQVELYNRPFCPTHIKTPLLSPSHLAHLPVSLSYPCACSNVFLLLVLNHHPNGLKDVGSYCSYIVFFPSQSAIEPLLCRRKRQNA